MAQFSKERILEWQKIIREDYGREVSFAEAEEATNNLIGFFDLLLKCDIKQNPHLYNKKLCQTKKQKE
jgi:hypothetical protein